MNKVLVTAAIFSIFTSAIALFLNLQCLCNCGISKRRQKVLGGEPSNMDEFPWISYLNVRNKTIRTGTLINNLYILTSASLVLGSTPYDIKVILGHSDRCTLEPSTTNYSVHSLIIHHGYSSTTKVNDLALIKLNTKVNFQKSILPICLGNIGEPYTGQVAEVLGWSTNRNSDLLSYCRRLKLDLPILKRMQCYSTAPNKQYLTSDKNCVGVIGAASGVCKNDAGGPIMHKNSDGIYELIGVLSDENICGNPPSTTIYTKIDTHLHWIKENTKDACYCVK